MKWIKASEPSQTPLSIKAGLLTRFGLILYLQTKSDILPLNNLLVPFGSYNAHDQNRVPAWEPKPEESLKPS